jgi:hypothetical protein
MSASMNWTFKKRLDIRNHGMGMGTTSKSYVCFFFYWYLLFFNLTRSFSLFLGSCHHDNHKERWWWIWLAPDDALAGIFWASCVFYISSVSFFVLIFLFITNKLLYRYQVLRLTTMRQDNEDNSRHPTDNRTRRQEDGARGRKWLKMSRSTRHTDIRFKTCWLTCLGAVGMFFFLLLI